MNFGLDSISFRGSLLWNTLDDSIKREKTLACFQKRIGKWLELDALVKYANKPPCLHIYAYIIFLRMQYFYFILFNFL